MSYPEFLEWVAFIRLQNISGDNPTRGPQSWRQQKEAMIRHMNIVKSHGRN